MIALFRIICMLTAFGTSALGQFIAEVAPDASKPGDLIVIHGSGLGQANSVEFMATPTSTGTTVSVFATPTVVAPNRVEVLMPTMPTFVPPPVPFPYFGIGGLRVHAPGAQSNTAFIFYMQAQPTISSLGQGTSQPGGIGRPLSSFSALGGAPLPGNTTFTMTLENAMPFVYAHMGFGYVDVAPYILIGDGTLLIDISVPYNIHSTPFITDANGAAFCPFSVPPTLAGFTAVVQWVALVPVTGSACITNGLVITF